MKIAVAGTGYVGLSIATLLAQKHEVVAVDVIPEKVEKINAKKSPIADEFLEKYLAEKPLNLRATLDGREAYRDADFVVIATPTNYDPKKNFFDTSHVEEVIELVLEVNPDAVMVIKSTVPVGYTKSAREKFSYRERQADGTFRVVTPTILFAPEFLRESKALYDNLYPSRIIVGVDDESSGLRGRKLFLPKKVEKVLSDSGLDTEITSTKPYSRFRNMVRLHSWAPIYFDYDELSSMSGEFSYSMASPGITGLFQNDLGSLYGQIGYSAHPDAYSDGPWRHSGHLKLTYGGFYPKIEAGAAFNDHGTAVYHWNIVEKGDGGTLNTSYSIQNQIPSFNAYISAWLPLSQSKGGVTRGFIPKLTYSMSNSRFYTGAIELESSFPMELAPAFTGVRDGKTVIMQSLSGSVRAYSMLSRGESQTYPRWGIGAEMGGHIRPGLYQVFSPAMYGYIYGYVPGFTRLQGLRLNTLAQYLFRGEEMFPEMRVNCAPRGFGPSVGSYMAAKGNFHIKAGADYAIPIYAGDLSIFGSAAYIRNFLLIPHTDAAMFGKTFLGSTGIDITAEFATLLGLPFGASLGVSLNCLYGGAMSELRELELVNRRPFSAELIFSMDI